MCGWVDLAGCLEHAGEARGDGDDDGDLGHHAQAGGDLGGRQRPLARNPAVETARRGVIV